MINYLVKCPSDPYENTDCFNDLDLYDLCYNLSEEYGYRDWLLQCSRTLSTCCILRRLNHDHYC